MSGECIIMKTVSSTLTEKVTIGSRVLDIGSVLFQSRAISH